MADMGKAMPIQLAKVTPDPSCSKLRFLYRALKKLQQVVQTTTYIGSGCKSVNVLLNLHRNHEAYQGRGEGGVWRWEEGEYISVTTLSSPGRLLHSDGQR